MGGRRQRRRQPIVIELTVEKLVHGGQAMGHWSDADGENRFGDKTVFVWNALPGERVRAEITKRRKGIWEGVAIDIIEPSADRITPEEPDSYLSTSPWQIMATEKEIAYKEQIARETYQHIGKFDLPTHIETVHSEGAEFGYRNKMEFSFFEFDEDDERGEGVRLAFFHRGKRYKMPVDGSRLAEPVINQVAHRVLEWVNEHQLTRRELKTVIVRSNGQGQAIAAVFIKDKVNFESYPEVDETLLGLQVYYSTHKSPASVPTELLYTEGDSTLIAELMGTNLQFGLLSFFQVNIPVFERALQDIASVVPSDKPLLDFYAGVGAIGLPLAGSVPQVTCVEVNEQAVQFAQHNIDSNSILNAEAHCMPAEKMTEVITGNETVIVDPPRAGLHADVTERLLETRPDTIVYMSCNISTQARDIGLLAEQYAVTDLKLYNFFPRTPHIEALAILKRK